jgi:hypothetical protein
MSAVEAASGFEPENGGFADLCLTTWLCRLVPKDQFVYAYPARLSTFLFVFCCPVRRGGAVAVAEGPICQIEARPSTRNCKKNKFFVQYAGNIYFMEHWPGRALGLEMGLASQPPASFTV